MKLKYRYKIILSLFALLLMIFIYNVIPMNDKTEVDKVGEPIENSINGQGLSADEQGEESDPKASTLKDLKTMKPDDDSDEAKSIAEEKMSIEDPESVDSSIFYDVENLNEELELAFTCQQKNCQYDDTETDLKGIPLLKHWAIEAPYFYTTAQGDEAAIPTILFVNTQTGLWFVLNRHQGSDEMMSCIEFGKGGRLSAEESLCSPKDTPAGMLGDMVTLIEEVEMWRSQ
ncbi:MAG: hypothetical protein KAH22_01695 [Thiotrichaceae bacterium]|nr:hypothetical protein [Thiotrichaceae bacterium]